MNSEEKKLHALRQSLNQSPQNRELDTMQQKLQTIKNAEHHLQQLPAVYDELNKLLEKSRQETDFKQTLDGFAVQLTQLTVDNQRILNRVEALVSGVETRLKQINITDAKHNNLINRIDTVLVQLERALRQS